MRILYVTDTGEMRGGGEVSLLALLRELDRSRFAPVVACPGEGGLTCACRALGIPVFIFPLVPIRGPFSLARAWKGRQELDEIIRSQEIDLVHTNSTGSVVLLAGLACGKSVPLVAHCRIFPRGIPADAWMACFSRAVIVSSRALVRNARWACGRRIRCIPNGVDLSSFYSTSENGGGPAVGTLASPVAGKGLEYFVDAAVCVGKKFPAARFYLAGFEAHESRYGRALFKRIAASGMDDHFILPGKVHDVPAFMAGLTVFVFPSRIDAFGRAAIEAMAAAKPVVGFRVNAMPEIVENGVTGFLCRPGDAAGLAAGIGRLLSDPGRCRRMGQAGLQRCRRLFDIREHVRRIEAVYEECRV